MRGLTRRVLGRLPAHLEPTRPGKLLGSVADAIAADLDTLMAQLAWVRRAHRLGHADHVGDVMRLGTLHGIAHADVAVLTLRAASVRVLAAALESLVLEAREAETLADATARDAMARELLALWPLDLTALGVGAGSLEPWTTAEEETGSPPADAEAADDAALRLARACLSAFAYAEIAGATRRRVARIAANHGRGNGTVMALLEGTSAALDAEILRVQHSEDRFWHAAELRDLLPLTRPDPAQPERDVAAPMVTEVIGLEENPSHVAETDRLPREHADRFSVLRRGFEREGLSVKVWGMADSTHGPRLTNMDEGRGVGFAGHVPDGQLLIFDETGRVTLDGDNVTGFAYAWEGGCFAPAPGSADDDFVFAGGGHERAATFAVATPPGALDSDAVFPHAGLPLPMPSLGIGKTRFAFFVQAAHASHERSAVGGSPPGPVEVLAVTPRHAIGFFDASVFVDEAELPLLETAAEVGLIEAAPTEGVPISPSDAEDLVGIDTTLLEDGSGFWPVGELSLAWREHEAYAVRVWLPPRLKALDAADGPGVASHVARALARFKAAGIDLRVVWQSDEWVLGESILGAQDTDDLLLRLLPRTVLGGASEGGDAG